MMMTTMTTTETSHVRARIGRRVGRRRDGNVRYFRARCSRAAIASRGRRRREAVDSRAGEYSGARTRTREASRRIMTTVNARVPPRVVVYEDDVNEEEQERRLRARFTRASPSAASSSIDARDALDALRRCEVGTGHGDSNAAPFAVVARRAHAPGMRRVSTSSDISDGYDVDLDDGMVLGSNSSSGRSSGGAVRALEAQMRRTSTTEEKENTVVVEEEPSDSNTLFTLVIATLNKPAVLAKVTNALDGCGLDVVEAHIFCSDDGYALDAFVVKGWTGKDAEALGQKMEVLLNADPVGDGDSRQRTTTLAAKHGARNRSFQRTSKNVSTSGPVHVDPFLLSRPPENDFSDSGRVDDGLFKATDCKTLTHEESFQSDIHEEDLAIGRRIGSGAFGALHHAVFSSSIGTKVVEREVAVKFLTITPENESTARHDFFQEVAVLQSLNHANVLGYVGSITRGEKLCLVTEYMQNGPLLKYLQETGAPKQRSAIKIALCIAQGMAYIHDDAGMVHRDLKASNVLLSDKCEAKICDFGLTRVVPNADESLMTAETGTYRWMAPEVIAHMPYSFSCDVYSYGILLWEMMSAGMIPYDDMNPLQAAVAVVQKGLRPIIPPKTSELFATLMQQCWLTVPDSRPTFQSIVQTLTEVDAALSGTNNPIQGESSFLRKFKFGSSTKKQLSLK